jgi:hypothetical protein
LLAEDNPDTLLRRYNCNTLEDVFLYLCRSEKFAIDTGEASLNRNESLTVMIENPDRNQSDSLIASTTSNNTLPQNHNHNQYQTQSTTEMTTTTTTTTTTTQPSLDRSPISVFSKEITLSINNNKTDNEKEPLLGFL